MPVIVDDETALNALLGRAVSSSFIHTNAGPRVYVLDDVDTSWGVPRSAAPRCASVGTFTLTYNDASARVEIAGTGFEAYDTVLIERSTNGQVSWTTVRGASELEVEDDGTFAINDYEFVDSVVNYYRVTTLTPISCEAVEVVSITPVLTAMWIKSVNRPFLNISISTACAAMGENDIEYLSSPGGVTRRARSALFPIINRTYEIAVNDIRLGRDWTMLLRTFTTLARKAVDFLLASGDVLYIQTPTGCALDTIEQGYVTAFDATYTRHHRHRDRVVWEIPVVEVAPPGPDIAYAESTWQTVINRYGTWQDVLDAHSSWASLLTELPDPSEVIVP